jgi:hypothetical protein
MRSPPNGIVNFEAPVSPAEASFLKTVGVADKGFFLGV